MLKTQGGSYRPSQSVLFFGEMPPDSIHGISISNEINIDILKQYYHVTVVKELSDLRYHEKKSPSKALKFISSYWHFFKELLKKKYDIFYGVIYLSTFGILKNICVIGLFRIFNKEGITIVHFHRSDFDMFGSKKVNRFLFSILDRLTSKYILLSNAQQNKNISIHPSKRFILYNTIEEKYGQKKYTSNNNPNQLQAVYIGNYIKEKGIFELIEAIQKYNLSEVPIIKLNCYGNTTTNENKHMLQAYNDPNVIVNGPITGKEKFEVLAAADVIILPSYNEGMPLILLEAMFVGLPVIISKVGFITDALGENYPLYCTPKDTASIIRCIKEFLIIDRPHLSHDLKKKYIRFSNTEHCRYLLKIFEHPDYNSTKRSEVHYFQQSKP